MHVLHGQPVALQPDEVELHPRLDVQQDEVKLNSGAPEDKARPREQYLPEQNDVLPVPVQFELQQDAPPPEQQDELRVQGDVRESRGRRGPRREADLVREGRAEGPASS